MAFWIHHPPVSKSYQVIADTNHYDSHSWASLSFMGPFSMLFLIDPSLSLLRATVCVACTCVIDVAFRGPLRDAEVLALRFQHSKGTMPRPWRLNHEKNGRFLKWGYPKLIHFNGSLPLYTIQFFGNPPFPGNPHMTTWMGTTSGCSLWMVLIHTTMAFDNNL